MQRSNKNFVFTDISYLLLATLISSFSNFFLVLSVSELTYVQTGSHLKSASVFAVSWILPIFLLPLTKKLLEMFRTEKLLLALMIFQAIFSIFVFFAFQTSIFLLFFILAIRGYLNGIETTGRQVVLKRIVENSHIQRNSSFLSTANYTGMFLGGGINIALFSNQVGSILSVTSILFFVSGVLYFRIKSQVSESRKVEPAEKPMIGGLGYLEGFIEIKKQGLFWIASRFLLNVLFFQGYHNVARTAFPTEILHLPVNSVGLLQIISTAAVIMGASSVGIFESFFRRAGEVLFQKDNFIFMTLAFFFITTLIKNPIFSFASYFFFIFFFEVSFTIFQNEIIRSSSKESIIPIMASINAINILSLSLSVVFIGILVDAFGLITINLTICLVILILVFMFNYFEKTFRKSPMVSDPVYGVNDEP